MNPQEHELTYPWAEVPALGAVTELRPGLFWVRMRLPFALDHINLWLLEDEIDGVRGWTIVDCGIASDETRSAWERIFDTVFDGRSLLLAGAAGVSFGLFFIAFAGTSQEAGLWPLVAARVLTIPLATAFAIISRTAVRPRGSTVRFVAGVGAFDVTATIALALALQRGPLAVNAVLSSLFPAFTAIAAVVLLRERPARHQAAGIVLALVAAAMLAV